MTGTLELEAIRLVAARVLHGDVPWPEAERHAREMDAPVPRHRNAAGHAGRRCRAEFDEARRLAERLSAERARARPPDQRLFIGVVWRSMMRARAQATSTAPRSSCARAGTGLGRVRRARDPLDDRRVPRGVLARRGRLDEAEACSTRRSRSARPTTGSPSRGPTGSRLRRLRARRPRVGVRARREAVELVDVAGVPHDAAGHPALPRGDPGRRRPHRARRARRSPGRARSPSARARPLLVDRVTGSSARLTRSPPTLSQCRKFSTSRTRSPPSWRGWGTACSTRCATGSAARPPAR